MTVTVVLADDEHLVRAGLRTVLERDAGIEVVAEASDGIEAVRVVREHRPDVVLMDIRMPQLDGIEATTRLSSDPSVQSRIVILTTFDDDELLGRALRAGALGYLLKSMPAAQLCAAVHTAAVGDALLAPPMVQRLLAERMLAGARHDVGAGLREGLSARELEVLLLVAQGLSNDEIANHMVVAVATVKSHVSALLQKLQARDRVQLVVLAYDSGLVSPR